MKLKDVMSKDIRTVDPSTPLAEAAAIMNREGIGMLPVLGLARIPIGVITDRDIALRIFETGMGSSASVREAMTSPAYTIDQDREVDAALVMMATARVRRLIVCDERGHLAGVFSLADAEICCHDNPRLLDLRRALAHRVKHAQTGSHTIILR